MLNIFEKVQMGIVGILGLIGAVASAGIVQLACGLGIILAVLVEMLVKQNLVRNGFYK
jgi:hypothetical protein